MESRTESNIDVDEYQRVINEILPGLTMYVRDVNLSPQCFSQYHVGMIITERGFTDASSRVKGMVTTHRYAILSNHMGDLSQYENDTNWGLYVARNNAYFKVLDIHDYKSKTQILLLHLPDDIRWKMFDNVELSIEQNIISDSRKRFESKCLLKPIPELESKDWMDRCSHPLGMSDNGELYELDFVLDNMMRNVKGADFRDFYHTFLYLKCPKEQLKRLQSSFKISAQSDGLLVYGYIDGQCGLSFSIICGASVKNNQLSLSEFDKKVMKIVRKDYIDDWSYLSLCYVDVDLSAYSDIADRINKSYTEPNRQTEEMRGLRFLDESRHQDFPDDIKIVLVKEGLNPEQVWGKCWLYTEKELFARLLVEPEQDFGLHNGDIISFIPVENGGHILCIHSENK